MGYQNVSRNSKNITVINITLSLDVTSCIFAFRRMVPSSYGCRQQLPARPYHMTTKLRDVTTQNNVTLVDFQLDAQNSYLFIYNTFIKILYMFRALPCSSSGGLRHNCIYAASGIVTLCRWLSCAPVTKEFFLNRYTRQSPAESDDTRGCIYTITTQTSWRWAG